MNCKDCAMFICFREDRDGTTSGGCELDGSGYSSTIKNAESDVCTMYRNKREQNQKFQSHLLNEKKSIGFKGDTNIF